MSMARKCDICGSLYEYYEGIHDDGRKANTINIAYLTSNYVVSSSTRYDCCPECMRAIELFIGELAEMGQIKIGEKE